MEGVTFQAMFYNAKSLPNGEWRVTLDVDKESAASVLQLSQLDGYLLQVAVIPIDETASPRKDPDDGETTSGYRSGTSL